MNLGEDVNLEQVRICIRFMSNTIFIQLFRYLNPNSESSLVLHSFLHSDSFIFRTNTDALVDCQVLHIPFPANIDLTRAMWCTDPYRQPRH